MTADGRHLRTVSQPTSYKHRFAVTVGRYIMTYTLDTEPDLEFQSPRQRKLGRHILKIWNNLWKEKANILNIFIEFL